LSESSSRERNDLSSIRKLGDVGKGYVLQCVPYQLDTMKQKVPKCAHHMPEFYSCVQDALARMRQWDSGPTEVSRLI